MMTYGQMFDKALELAKNGTETEINWFMSGCIADLIEGGMPVHEATKVAYNNIQYMAGYYDTATQKLIASKFKEA